MLNHEQNKLLHHFNILPIEFSGVLKFANDIALIDSQFKISSFLVGHFHYKNCTPYTIEHRCNNCLEVTHLNDEKFDRSLNSNATYSLEGLDYACCPEKTDEKFAF